MTLQSLLEGKAEKNQCENKEVVGEQVYCWDLLKEEINITLRVIENDRRTHHCKIHIYITFIRGFADKHQCFTMDGQPFRDLDTGGVFVKIFFN